MTMTVLRRVAMFGAACVVFQMNQGIIVNRSSSSFDMEDLEQKVNNPSPLDSQEEARQAQLEIEAETPTRTLQSEQEGETTKVKSESEPEPESVPSIATASVQENAVKFYERHYSSMSLLNPSQNQNQNSTKKERDVMSWLRPGKADKGFLHQYLVMLPHYQIVGGGAADAGIPIHDWMASYKTKFKDRSHMKAFDVPTKGEPYAKHFLHVEFKSGLCRAAKFFQAYHSHPKHKDTPWPHVLFVGMHRDFGALSQYWEGQTYPSNHRLKEWQKQGCTKEFIQEYLDHPDTLAMVTTQYHMFDHPKAHSIPLGVKGSGSALTALDYLAVKAGDKQPKTTSAPKGPLHNRPKLAMLNFKPWGKQMRNHIRTHLEEYLTSDKYHYKNGTQVAMKNSYNKIRPGDDMAKVHMDNYYQELMGSKFIFSPAGWGIDCYRTWEALYAGTIPVLETLDRQDGWFRTFDDLPVAWIDHYANITPDWLEEQYPKIMEKWDTYNWDKMKASWWIQWAQKFVDDRIGGGDHGEATSEATAREGIYDGSDDDT